MTDREKVIKGLTIERECVSRNCDRDCSKCDLVQDREWLLSVYDDALELLKLQEPARAIREFSDDFSYDGDSWWYECGNCLNPIDCHDVFCSYCGKRLVWDAGQGESDKPLANHTNMGSCRP